MYLSIMDNDGEWNGAQTGLVERDVAVLADAAEEELDAAVGRDLGLVRLALVDEILGVTVQDIDLARRDVDCVERERR